MEDIRQRFLAAISEKELDPSTQLSKEKYNEILRRLRELPTTKKSSSDYRILKRYKIVDLHTNGQTMTKLYCRITKQSKIVLASGKRILKQITIMVVELDRRNRTGNVNSLEITNKYKIKKLQLTKQNSVLHIVIAQ